MRAQPLLPADDPARLLGFNRQLLGQALALVAAHTDPAGPVFAGVVGSHLRHVIEHYEALVFESYDNVIDYDSRRRDAVLERSPVLARERLQALQDRLAGWPADTLGEAVRVLGQAGLGGEFRFAVTSTIARELVFLAGHTVHHFALLKAHCQKEGIATTADFGKAPATIAHERSTRSVQPLAHQTKETKCPAPLLCA